MVKLLITTVPGLEDIVVREFKDRGVEVVKHEVLGSRKFSGRVLIEVNKVDMSTLRKFRSIEKVYLVLNEGFIGSSKDELVKVINEIDWSVLSDYITTHTSIAVKSTRVGEHEYTSIEIANYVGKKVIEYFRSLGKELLVDLDSPDLVICFDVINNKYTLSIELTRRSLRERNYRIYKHEAAINPIIAYAMNYLITILDHVSSGDVFWDPMCGSGTIIIEGLHVHKDIIYLGSDINYKHVKGAYLNIMNAGLIDKVILFVSDVLNASKLVRNRCIKYVVTNPPYGIRIEPIEDIVTFYRKLVQNLSEVIDKDGYIVIISMRSDLLKRFSRKFRLSIVYEKLIYQGGRESTILVFRKD